MTHTDHHIEIEEMDEAERKRLAEETRSNLDHNGDRAEEDA
jgi:hypothetical protein